MTIQYIAKRIRYYIPEEIRGGHSGFTEYIFTFDPLAFQSQDGINIFCLHEISLFSPDIVNITATNGGPASSAARNPR